MSAEFWIVSLHAVSILRSNSKTSHILTVTSESCFTGNPNHEASYCRWGLLALSPMLPVYPVLAQCYSR